MPTPDGRAGSPSTDSVDVEIANQNRRITELTRAGGLSGREAVHRVRTEDNAELVKSNAAAQSPARSQSSEPQRSQITARDERPTQIARKPQRVAPRSYNYTRGDLASHQTDGVRQLEAKNKYRARHQGYQQKTGPEKPAPAPSKTREDTGDLKPHALSQTDKADRYRELIKAIETRQFSRDGSDRSRS